MEREGLSEQEAFARLRKASQISGRPLKVVAEALVATMGDAPLGTREPVPEDSAPAQALGRPVVRCGQQTIVLTAAVEAVTEPGGDPEDRERGDHDEEAESDHALPGEDVQRLVDRPVEPLGGGATAPNAPGVATVSWMVDMRASALVDAIPALISRSSAEVSAGELREGLGSPRRAARSPGGR